LDFSEHVIISAAGSASILISGGDWASAAAFSVAGVFVDLDHLIDYWRETGWNTDIPTFMSYFYQRKPKKLLLLLHAWEWIALSAALARAFHSSPLWLFWGILGWLCHLLLDQRFNRLQPLSYFFFYRAHKGFDAKSFYND
jgi:hypothetical protein